MAKLPTSFPSLIINDNSVVTLQRALQDVARALQQISGANNFPDQGTTASRPTQQLAIGQTFFDRTLGKPIWWQAGVWVDATGTPV